MAIPKFFLECGPCGRRVDSFPQWFRCGQVCPACGSPQVRVQYQQDFSHLHSLLRSEQKHSSIWRYFDFLPLHDEASICSLGEGNVAIQRWRYLERFAGERYRIDCQIYAQRFDQSPATGTFKDLAGSVVASVLQENGVRDYVAASTGNIGVSLASYLNEAGISAKVFIPQTSPALQAQAIQDARQEVIRVAGDYAQTKEAATRFASQSGTLAAAGSFDPMRIEAKKTIVYEWLRLLPEFPTVYIQAVSGGTGPLGVVKGCDELEAKGFFERRPRLLLAQSDRCCPMASAWETAKSQGFPGGWEKAFPVITNPGTEIATLATGNPTAYPVLARAVRQSGGEFLQVHEQEIHSWSVLAAAEMGVRIGPAAAVMLGGFFEALRNDHLHNGDIVVLNVGEGIRRTATCSQADATPATQANSRSLTKIGNKTRRAA